MIKVDLISPAKAPAAARRLKRAVFAAARCIPKINGRASLILVGEATMRALNKKTRGVDKSTDVLSFAWQEGNGAAPGELGEIYLCYPYLIKQAKRFGVPASEEFYRSFFHGLLHLVGYDHVRPAEAKRMFNLQEKLLRIFGP